MLDNESARYCQILKVSRLALIITKLSYAESLSICVVPVSEDRSLYPYVPKETKFNPALAN